MTTLSGALQITLQFPMSRCDFVRIPPGDDDLNFRLNLSSALRNATSSFLWRFNAKIQGHDPRAHFPVELEGLMGVVTVAFAVRSDSREAMPGCCVFSGYCFVGFVVAFRSAVSMPAPEEFIPGLQSRHAILGSILSHLTISQADHILKLCMSLWYLLASSERSAPCKKPGICGD